MDLGLTDSVAIVIGGASGIGRATAELFVAEGSCVALVDMSETVETTAGEIGPSTRVRGFRADISDVAAVEAAFQSIASTFAGSIRSLVHAAAIGSGRFGSPFTNLKPDEWKRVLDVNIQGLVHVAHAAAPHLIDGGNGSFVFVSSVAGQIGSPTDPPYSASKAAGINFAQCMAKDLANHNVRVNTVCPGMVKTPLNRSVWQAWHDRQPPEQQLDYEAWAAEKIEQLVPLGRWQKPQDVADLIVFLCSDRASEITGQTMNVDGGYVMHW